jgi:mono/diheme cytochrome c family protein
MRRRIARGAAALVSLSFMSLLSACGESAPDPTFAHRTGEVLLARGNCTACHTAGAEVVERIRPLVAPTLLGENGVGTRLSPAYLRDYIADPHATKRGTRMPHVLHGLDTAERERQATALTAYLSAQRPTSWTAPEPSVVLPDLVEVGERLYRTSGCAACHNIAEQSRLARATHLDALTALILDPLATHPSGLMPRVPMSDDEARAIAAYMLADQAKDASGSVVAADAPGLRVEYYEREFTSDGLTDDITGPDRVFTIAAPTIDFPRREEHFGARFTGTLTVPADGQYEFHLGSDDGSRLELDGAVVIDHWGAHGFAYKSKRVTLTKGPKAFRLVYYELSVDDDLRLEWSGPGIKRQPIAAEHFTHDALVLRPPAMPAADASLAAEGERLFGSLGCASCHAGQAPTGGIAFADLRGTRGCLADRPTAAAPDFGLDAAARTALREALDHANDLRAPLPPARFVEHAVHRLGCVSCHQRDGLGGPNQFTAEFFVSDGHAELGDQGRIPPRLDGVGDKLRPEALADVLANGTKVRPYMLTRMPVYGDEATRGLAEQFGRADRVPAHDAAPAFSVESAQAGRTLVGSTGVSCITCHTFNGRASLGVPAVDLGKMHDRLRPGWFLAFLEHPDRFTPGTRMTRFWLPENRIFENIFAGDGKRQREAIWNYLSLGESMTPPAGLRITDGEWELIPVDEPMVFTTFMRGVSPRTICVGYTDLVHIAYDAEGSRLAKAWRGAFMNAAGTWEGRAGQLSSPAGTSVIDLPPGDAVAALASREASWPDRSFRFVGVERDRDRDRTPRFNGLLGGTLEGPGDGLRVRESAVPSLSAQGVALRRTIEVWAEADRSDLYFRLAVGRTIEQKGNTFVVDGSLTVVPVSPGAFVRTAGDQRELLLPVDLKYLESETPRYKATAEADLLW